MSEQVSHDLRTVAFTINNDAGPRELTIFDPAGLVPLLGTRRVKGPFYGAMEKTLNHNQEPEFHKQRRRIWDMAFKQSGSSPIANVYLC